MTFLRVCVTNHYVANILAISVLVTYEPHSHLSYQVVTSFLCTTPLLLSYHNPILHYASPFLLFELHSSIHNSFLHLYFKLLYVTGDLFCLKNSNSEFFQTVQYNVVVAYYSHKTPLPLFLQNIHRLAFVIQNASL